MHIKDHSAAMKFFRTYDSAASKGKWKEFVDEMEFDSMVQEPRTMAQEPRNMYAGGQLVQNTVDGSRPGYSGDEVDIGDRASRNPNQGVTKLGPPKIVDTNIQKITYLDKATGKKITIYKSLIKNSPKSVGGKQIAGISGDYKNALLNKEFFTLEEAKTARDSFREKTPKKITPRNPKLDYITKDKRRLNIKEQGGVESYKAAKEGSGIHKGHATNIKNPNLIIKPKNIIYTPEKINLDMSPKVRKGTKKPTSKYAYLDFKINAAEDEMKAIKKSNMPAAKKKIELGKLDDKLMKYVDLSDGYKTVTLSNNKSYGEVFQSMKSMDMFNEFPGKSEKDVKEFVGNYFTQDRKIDGKIKYGKLKPEYEELIKNNKLTALDEANIIKAYTFNENVKNAQKNATKVLTGWCSPGKQIVKKAGGGRIGFGGCPDSEKITNMKNAAAQLKQHKLYLMGKATTTPFADNAAAKALALKMTKSGGLLMRIGKVATGPLTLWGEPLFEGAFIAHDILGTGTPWKEAVAKSLWAKPAISMGLLKPADQQYDEALWQVQNEEGEALMVDPYHERVRTPIKRFIDNNKKIDKLNKLFTLKQNSHIMGPRSFTQDERETKIKNADETYKDYLKSLGGAEGVRDIENQISEDQEAYDTRVAALEIERKGITEDDIFTPSGLKRPGVERDADIKQKQAEEDLMYQKYGKTRAKNVGKEGTPGEFKDKWITDPEFKSGIDEQLKSFGDYYGRGYTPYGLGYGMSNGKYNEDLGYKQVAEEMADVEARDRIARAGGVANMASGGRAGFADGGLAGLMKKYYD